LSSEQFFYSLAAIVFAFVFHFSKAFSVRPIFETSDDHPYTMTQNSDEMIFDSAMLSFTRV
jgi:hypothetical protein